MELALRDTNNAVIVTINGIQEEHSLTDIPKKTSLVVASEKQIVLQDLDLPSVIINLKNSASLLNIAYHAVNGTSLQPKIFNLEKRLLDISDKSLITVQSFGIKSNNVLIELQDVYKWLTSCMEDMAIDRLKACAAYAKDMRIKADALRESFQKMADDTSLVLQDTMSEQATRYDKNEKIQQTINTFMAEQDAREKLQESLKANIANVKKRYAEVKSALEKAEKSEETMAVVSLVCNVVGSVIAPVSSIISNVASSGKQQGQPSNSTQKTDTAQPAPQSSSEQAEKEKELAEVQRSVAATSASVEDVKNTLQSLEEEKASKQKVLVAGTEEEKKKAEQDIQQLDTKINAAKAEQDTLLGRKKEQEAQQEKLKLAVSVLSSAASGLNAVAGTTQQAASNAHSTAAGYREQLDKIFDSLMRLEAENTKNLSELAKFATLIKNAKLDQNALEAAIQALMIAITCLKNVVVIMKDVALFWAAMEACCESLSDERLADLLMKLQDYEEEKRRKLYFSSSIVKPLFTTMVRWAALTSICEDYVDAVNKTRKALVENIASPEMAREKHWQAASRLAEDVLKNLTAQLAESQTKQKQIAEQKAESMSAI